jgi:hypothetical protein
MQRWVHKILMLVAVATIVGHNCMPHHHHDGIKLLSHHEEVEKNNDHHDHEQNTEDHHSIFSFVQLDEDFIPTKFQVVGFELPVLYLPTPEISYQLKLSTSTTEAFTYYREYPPPENCFLNLPSRAPPAC